MTIRATIICLFSVLIVLLCGCRTQQVAWTEERARSVAFETMRKHKLEPSDFDAPQVKRTPDGWFLGFWPKSRILDTDAWVTIDERTGKITLAQGFTVFQ